MKKTPEEIALERKVQNLNNRKNAYMFKAGWRACLKWITGVFEVD